MRTTNTCPKCHEKKLAVIGNVRHGPYDPNNITIAIPAVTVALGGEPARYVVTADGREALGWVESWICIACGFTEFYAHSYKAEDFDRLAREHPEQVRIVNAKPREPYR